ncbi:hypothetical protein GB992_07705 [Lactobacillus rossiae]|uniref:Uncharacterized protein n=1 Tax=Furfurilactobacillus rossiae TaxID=231049 RepID=A0A7C9IYM7_9LACO|nr:hypothetical protein [Furfurilactobacillus milii]
MRILRRVAPKPWEKLSNNVEGVAFGGLPDETTFGLCAGFWATGARLGRVPPKLGKARATT